MFFDKEDDDQDFMLPGRSKLGALFGMDKAGHHGGNESLTYTAPKQPKKQEASGTVKGTAPAVMFALAVHAYKYVDNKYVSQGKLGAAILASHATSEYSILMYVSQQQKITTAKITSTFTYTCQPNNYANFYDDGRQSWSILFESEQNSVDFAKHVCLAKALSTGPVPTGLCSQDIVLGEGGVLDNEDSVEVKYTGWLLTNNTFGQVFDSNANVDKLFRFKLGAGKVIKGWDTGLLGMKKGGKRFIVVPPNMAYGAQGMGSKVPANSTLLFEVEVIRVKLVGKESSPSPVQQPPQPATVGMSGDTDDFEEEDQSVKMRTKSITEQLAQSPTQDTSKAKLISRMAKMGKPMLPLSGAVAANPEGDEEPMMESPVPVVSQAIREDVNVLRPTPKPAIAPMIQTQPIQQQGYPVMYNQAQAQPAFLQNLPAAQQVAMYQPQQTFLQQQQMQPQMYAGGIVSQPLAGNSFPQYIVPGVQQSADMMMISETRQQNTEMRLSLSKVQDKVEQVIQKLDHAISPNSGTAMLPNMETSVLLHNITRIVQENERLKKDVFEKSAKIESQNEKISELLQRNQNFVEKSQVLMEQRNEGLLSSANQNQNRVLSLEQDKVDLSTRLSEASSQISNLQLELAALKKKEFELSQHIDITSRDTHRKTEELETFRVQHSDDERIIKDLQRQLKDEKQSRKSVETSFSQLQEEIADLQSTKQALEKIVSERKRKAAEERRQLEDDMEDAKANMEAEIQSLKEKLRKQKTSASTTSQEQISQMEAEITKEWKDKYDRMLAAANEKHTRALKTVEEEKQNLEIKVEQLENKVHAWRQNSSSSEGKIEQLQEQIEQLAVWKDKYEVFRNNATSMKERYEKRIKEIESEKDSLNTHMQSLQTEIIILKDRPPVQSVTTVIAPQEPGNLLEEVKKIMNSVFKEMKETFKVGQMYPGQEILAVILSSIKSSTLSLMKRGENTLESNVDDDEEEEEEEAQEEENEEESEEEEIEEIETVSKKEAISEEASPYPPNTESALAPDTAVSELDQNSVSEDTDSYIDELDRNLEGENNVKDLDNTEFTEIITNLDIASDDNNYITENIVVNHDDLSKDLSSVEEANVPVLKNDLSSVPTDPLTDFTKQPSDFNLKKADSFDELFNVTLEKGVPLVSTEPPPLLEDNNGDQDDISEDKSRTKSLFQDDDCDNNVAEIFVATKKPTVTEVPVKKTSDRQAKNDEDLKSKPPPPLFDDDDDDDDLDWLS